MSDIRRCARCSSAVCDGRVVTCLGCGTTQCHGNGLGRGSCSLCHYGILPGWSSWKKRCGYKGCTNQAAFHNVRGTAKTVCHDCATRPKVTLMTRTDLVGRTVERVKVSLSEYAARCRLAPQLGKGVVQPGEQAEWRPLYLSEEDERNVAAMYERAKSLVYRSESAA